MRLTRSRTLDVEKSRSARKYKKYEVLFRQGEVCKGAFVVLSGRVALSTGLSEDQRLHIAYFEEGAVLGLVESLSGCNYQTWAVAATSVTAEFLPYRDIVDLAKMDSSNDWRVLSSFAADLESLQKRIKALAFYRAKSPKISICQ